MCRRKNEAIDLSQLCYPSFAAAISKILITVHDEDLNLRTLKEWSLLMLRKRFTMYALFICCLLFIDIIFFPVVSFAHAETVSISHISTPTSTIDPQSVLERAQDAVNTSNIIGAIMGVVLTFIGIFAVALSFLGFNTYRDVREQTKVLRKNVEEAQMEAMKTREIFMYISLGDRLYNQKKISEALEYYRSASRLLPQDVEVNYVLGRIFSELGDYEEAIRTLEPISTLNVEGSSSSNRRSKVYKELGLAYRRRGERLHNESDYEKALACLNEAIKLNGNDDNAYAIRGGLYRRMNKLRSALEEYRKSWQLNANSTYALGNIASLTWYLDDVKTSKEYFAIAEPLARMRVKQGKPDAYWDYYDLALAQLASGKLKEAQVSYRKAIDLTPGREQFEAVLSNLYLLQKSSQKMPELDDIVTLIETTRDQG
jgi:tetratricopeptide (TPR) repeat protein